MFLLAAEDRLPGRTEGLSKESPTSPQAVPINTGADVGKGGSVGTAALGLKLEVFLKAKYRSTV